MELTLESSAERGAAPLWRKLHMQREREKTSHCMKTGGFADWERSKVDGVRMSWGKKKVREATDSQAVSWDAVLRRGILFPVAVIISPPLNLLLNLEYCSWKPLSPQRSPRMCAGKFNAFCFSYVLNILRNKYKWWLAAIQHTRSFHQFWRIQYVSTSPPTETCCLK